MTRAGAVSGWSSMRAASSIRVHARCSCVGRQACGCGCSPSAETSIAMDRTRRSLRFLDNPRVEARPPGVGMDSVPSAVPRCCTAAHSGRRWQVERRAVGGRRHHPHPAPPPWRCRPPPPPPPPPPRHPPLPAAADHTAGFCSHCPLTRRCWPSPFGVDEEGHEVPRAARRRATAQPNFWPNSAAAWGRATAPPCLFIAFLGCHPSQNIRNLVARLLFVRSHQNGFVDQSMHPFH